MNDYIGVTENYAMPIQNLSSELTLHEQAALNEWFYWVNEMKIKAGEWIELFLEQPKSSTTIWMEKDSRSLPGSLQIKKSPVNGSQVIRDFIDTFEGRQASFGRPER